MKQVESQADDKFTKTIKEKAKTPSEILNEHDRVMAKVLNVPFTDAEDQKWHERKWIPQDDVLAEYGKAQAEHKQKLQDLLKTCPLLPNLTMMSVTERSKLLATHSIALDEWYQDLKRFVHEKFVEVLG